MDVARKLGLQGDAKAFDCFREHPRGDSRRSLKVHGKSNTMRCFRCDRQRSLSNIDLVMQVSGYDVAKAILRIADTFPGVPAVELRPGHHVRSRKPTPTSRLTPQSLITSQGWVAMSSAAKIIVIAILARCPAAGSEQNCLRCSYNRLRDWTDLSSRATIAKALRELRQTGAIQTDTVPTNSRTRRGFWLKELFVRVSPRAMQGPAPRIPRAASTGTNQTSTSVQKLNPQYAVQILNSEPGSGPA